MDYVRTVPLVPDRGIGNGARCLRAMSFTSPDVQADPDYTSREASKLGDFRYHPRCAAAARRQADRRHRHLTRSEVDRLPTSRSNWLTTFADQAVIAIENARLFDEIAGKTATGAADRDRRHPQGHRQFADDVQPVFKAIVERSNRACRGLSTRSYAVDGRRLHLMAFTRDQSGGRSRRCRQSYPEPLSAVHLARSDRQGADRSHRRRRSRTPAAHLDARWHGCAAAAAMLVVPLLREDEAIGVDHASTRVEVRPFTDKQIELLQTFADQAVIAIENVRLFEEVQAAHARTVAIARRPAHRAGPPDPDREAGLARPAHRWHRARDQEPAQFRQQFLCAVGGTDRRTE